ncbi:MAG: hypothetical protein M3P93_17285, partial [Actinomycetota bacterium]|nr:hypothetical protein [Actinomycetota bacterium]
MPVPGYGCAAQRHALHEPLAGTAPERAASWLLVEHRGPEPSEGWPADVPAVLVGLLERAPALGVRPQLVRRAGRRRPWLPT